MTEREMPSQITTPPLRQRAFKPRTATGCKTCRIRRIKCDEAEPSCKQCLRGRRICDGYPHKLLPIRHNPNTLPVMSPTVSSALFETSQERRAFDFFRHRTVPQLSGSFEAPFWNRLLLQATHHEPALQYAVVALGALHERFELGLLTQNEVDHGFALQQYVKAIGLVMTPIRERAKQAADVALMTCILFVCFETLRGYHSVAVSHIDGGVKIISELQTRQVNSNLSFSPSPYVPLPILNQIFLRLDTQASQIASDRQPHLLSQNLSTSDSGNDEEIPSSFKSLEAARNALDCIRTCASRTAQTLPIPALKDPNAKTLSPSRTAEVKLSVDLIRNFSAIRLKQWSSAFESLLRDKHSLSETEQRAVLILKLHRVMMGISFTADFIHAMHDEMVWDMFFEDYKTMISYAAEILESTKEHKSWSSFTVDTEIILPIYFAAVKCRDSRWRRKAIELLRSGQRQEGIWNSLLTASVAERVVEIEEEGLDGAMVSAKEICRWNRVLGVEVRFATEQRGANLKYIKLGENGRIDRIEEWVEWDGNGRGGKLSQFQSNVVGFPLVGII